jgi:hypothetical protein
MMALCSVKTLDLIGMGALKLQEVCALGTHFVRYVLDQVQDAPERVGLPRPRAGYQLAGV